jgi:glucan phosphoethanolaminetransferase (alkaline phosphatase superfamily)
MTMFTYNSFSTKTTAAVLIGIAVAALLITLWLRGMFWRYATIVGLEAFLAIVIALAFPLMEMVLEEIVKDKLRKVGEQVRAHAKRTEAYYASNR